MLAGRCGCFCEAREPFRRFGTDGRYVAAATGHEFRAREAILGLSGRFVQSGPPERVLPNARVIRASENGTQAEVL